MANQSPGRIIDLNICSVSEKKKTTAPFLRKAKRNILLSTENVHLLEMLITHDITNCRYFVQTHEYCFLHLIIGKKKKNNSCTGEMNSGCPFVFNVKW